LECKSCSESHTFQGCDQSNFPKTLSEFPGDWVRSATPTGWEAGSSKAPDACPPSKIPEADSGGWPLEIILNFQIYVSKF
jgi:hypothetical protein